jgi:hypothetical protein
VSLSVEWHNVIVSIGATSVDHCLGLARDSQMKPQSLPLSGCCPKCCPGIQNPGLQEENLRMRGCTPKGMIALCPSGQKELAIVSFLTIGWLFGLVWWWTTSDGSAKCAPLGGGAQASPKWSMVGCVCSSGASLLWNCQLKFNWTMNPNQETSSRPHWDCVTCRQVVGIQFQFHSLVQWFKWKVQEG